MAKNNAGFSPPINDAQLENPTNFIIGDLQLENQGLEENIQILSAEPVGSAQTYINLYQDIAEVLDKTEQIYTIITQINQKKQEIVNISALGIGTFSPGITQPTCDLESNRNNLNSPVTSETGIILSQTTDPIGPGGIPITTPQIAFGVVREDSIRVEFYPRLEAQEAPNDNALENLSYSVLENSSSSFAGKGKETILFANATYFDGAINIRVWNNSGNWDTTWDGDDNVIGDYYKIVGGGSTCVGWASSITQLEDEIVALRNQLPQYLNPIKGFKNKKHGYQLRIWSYKRTQINNQDQIDVNTSMISVLQNPPFTS
jgi:hypothetical protein